LKRSVPALVSTALARVLRAVDFHDQARARSEEVHDESVEHDLLPKPCPELTATQRLPKHALRLRRSTAHAMRVSRQLLLLVKFAVCA
jgi:hypothetical protein